MGEYKIGEVDASEDDIHLRFLVTPQRTREETFYQACSVGAGARKAPGASSLSQGDGQASWK